MSARVRPDTITGVTALQDSYFLGGSAAGLMATLTTRPEPILVSAETVKDYQLRPGDLVNLRLQDAVAKQLTTVAFHYVGVVNEFPTAPKDSFFVANAAYVAAKTGSAAVGAFLVDTGGQDVGGAEVSTGDAPLPPTAAQPAATNPAAASSPSSPVIRARALNIAMSGCAGRNRAGRRPSARREGGMPAPWPVGDELLMSAP